MAVKWLTNDLENYYVEMNKAQELSNCNSEKELSPDF